MEWVGIFVIAVGSGIGFFELDRRGRTGWSYRLAACAILAVVITLAIGLSVPAGPSPWTGLILPAFAYSVVLSAQAWLIAEMLLKRFTSLLRFLPLYLLLIAVAVFITTAVVAALYPGS